MSSIATDSASPRADFLAAWNSSSDVGCGLDFVPVAMALAQASMGNWGRATRGTMLWPCFALSSSRTPANVSRKSKAARSHNHATARAPLETDVSHATRAGARDRTGLRYITRATMRSFRPLTAPSKTSTSS